MDGVSMEKVFYGHLRQYETEYESLVRGSQVEGRNRQGYQQGGLIYNIDYDRKPHHMIDNQMRQDTRINVNMNRELKEEIIREVEERITFFGAESKDTTSTKHDTTVPSARHNNINTSPIK